MHGPRRYSIIPLFALPRGMKHFRVATFNANSIRARLGAVLAWLERESPDVLCLQETKVQDKDFPVKEFTGLGYNVLFRGEKSYNGVAIVTPHPAAEVRFSLYGKGDEEARFLSAVIQGVPILNVYVPQGFSPGTEKFDFKLRWLGDVLSHVKERYDPERPLLLAGDFNVALEDADVFDPAGLRGQVGFHADEQAILREYLAWGLVDIFRLHSKEGGHYTFWDYRIANAVKRRMGWRIDYILASPPLAERSRKVWIDKEARLGEKPSDHTYLVAEFEVGGQGVME